jgi:hypothetical protein
MNPRPVCLISAGGVVVARRASLAAGLSCAAQLLRKNGGPGRLYVRWEVPASEMGEGRAAYAEEYTLSRAASD